MPLLLYILLGVVLLGGGGALWYMMPPGGETPPVVSDRVASADPGKQPDAARDEAGGDTAPTPGADAAASPSFDVVRIEKDGEGVIAGRAEPGWTVIVESNGREIARTTADEFGEWMVLLDKPLPPGEHSMGLRAFSKGAALDRASEQHVSVSIAGEKSAEQTVVALSKPGEPTKVLTPEEPANPVPAAQTAARNPEPSLARKPEAQTVKLEEQKPAEVAKAEEAAKPAPAAPAVEVAVSFNAVDYEIAGDGSGELFLSGDASSGARVQLYLNNKRIGDAVAGPDGGWTFRSASKLAPRTEHTMRADAVQADGQVTSRAEVAFTPPAIPQSETQVAARTERQEPAALAPKQAEAGKAREATSSAAMAKPEPSASARENPQVVAEPKPHDAQQPEPSGQAAQEPAPPAEFAPSRMASRESEPQSASDAGASAVLNQKRSIVVRRGDTLWHIAKRRYGSGIRYTAIYRDNRDQIRDPDWIYPGQEFSLPTLAQ